MGVRTAFALAPDGRQLIYASCEYERRYPEGSPLAALHDDDDRYEYELVQVAADGRGGTRLTTDEHFDSYPAWSPDGRRLAFLSNRFNRLIHPFEFESGEQRNVLYGGSQEGFNDTGARIGLYTMAADGTDVRPVFEEGTPVAHQPPRWSPDGRQLAVVRYQDPGRGYSPRPEGRELYVVGADGTGARQLATDVVGGPSWSPDGARLAYAQAEGSGVALYTIARDGTDARRLTTLERWWRWPHKEDPKSVWIDTVAWSPDGTRILVSANGQHPAFVVSVDIPRRMAVGFMTKEVGPVGAREQEYRGVRAAAWSPDGGQIALVGPPRGGLRPVTVVAIASLDGQEVSVRRLAERAEEDGPLLVLNARAV